MDKKLFSGLVESMKQMNEIASGAPEGTPRGPAPPEQEPGRPLGLKPASSASVSLRTPNSAITPPDWESKAQPRQGPGPARRRQEGSR